MNAQRILARPTLVLNRNWAPIHTASVQRALTLVAKGSAKIVDPKTYAAHDLLSWNDVSRSRDSFGGFLIRSARLVLAVPELIVLIGYEGLAVRPAAFSRRSLFKRDRNTCQYCGRQPGASKLTIDHIQPRSRGGTTSWSNCVLACVECNAFKADRTPDEAGLKLRRAPGKPSWKVLAPIPWGTYDA